MYQSIVHEQPHLNWAIDKLPIPIIVVDNFYLLLIIYKIVSLIYQNSYKNISFHNHMSDGTFLLFIR